jgi:hypothetical protein
MADGCLVPVATERQWRGRAARMQHETTVVLPCSWAERVELESAARKAGVELATYLRRSVFSQALEDLLDKERAGATAPPATYEYGHSDVA